MDHVVVDVEIQKTIAETPGGWNATDKLGVAVACVWEYRTRRMRVYGPGDLQDLQDRLLRADRVSGFNIWRFDFPVIWQCPKLEWMEQPRTEVLADWRRLLDTKNDVLENIWLALGLNADEFTEAHRGWSLDTVARGTLNMGKIGYGGDAPYWVQAGEIQRVVNYCADDVALERDLVDFIDAYHYIVNGATNQIVTLSSRR